MTDVDLILRAHAEAAATAEPSPDGWEQIVARLEEEPPLIVPVDGRRPGRSRARALAAAVVVVAGLVAGAVALTRPAGEAEEVRPADTAPAPTTTEAATGRPDIADETMPDTVVAVLDHDRDGFPDVVRLDGIGVYEDVPAVGGGTARRVRPPQVTVLVRGVPSGSGPITSVEVGPDGLVLYGTGTDEAVGQVRAVDIADGTPHALDEGRVSGMVALGRDPATTADGRLIATIGSRDQVLLYDPRADTPEEELRRFAAPADGWELTGVGISPDGARLARERVTRAADRTITDVAVDVTGVDDPEGWEEVERSSGAGLPAFMEGGHLALGLGTFDASEGRTEVRASEVGMADLSTGQVRWSVGGGGFSFSTFDASPDGRWVLVAQEGVVRAFAAVDGWLWDSGTVVQLDGIVDAAW